MKIKSRTLDQCIEEQAKLDDVTIKNKPVSWADAPAVIIFALLFSVVFLQFFTRYVLNDSLSWTEEASRYLLIILAFVGVIKCELLDSHIRLEFIDQLMKRHVGLLKQLAATLSIIYFAFLGYTTLMLAMQTSFQKMVSLPFPKYYFYAFIILTLFALVLVQIRLFFQRFNGDIR